MQPRDRAAIGHRGAASDEGTRKRLIVMLLLLCTMVSALGLRVGQVQVLAADRYAAVGESQRVRSLQLPAERGSIFDRAGRDLALTMPQRTVWANPRLVSDPLKVAETLAPIVGVDQGLLQSRLSRDAAFVYLARKIDDDVAKQVEALDLDGVFFMDEPERFLPAGQLAAPVVGRVGLDNQGLSGLEAQYENVLVGRAGRKLVEHDPRGREIPGGVREFRPPVRGDDLVLTIDRSLQYETERALAREIVIANALGGMVIVMETATGEILALANLSKRPEGVGPSGSNTAVTNVYEPGSVNKLITISAALEEGIIGPADSLVVPDTIKVADHVFSEHDPHPTERWSITDIMANSSNVGTIMLGQRLGKDRIDHYLRQFGFGARTRLGFPGESAGLLLPPKKWSGTTIATVSIGQGIAVTALQMLAAYNTIANDGTYVAPKLVRATVGADGTQRPTPPAERRRALSERTARRITAMLDQAVRSGTGELAAIEGYSVAGKTGTARKPLVGARGYKAGAYMSSFAGFVPAERPALTGIVILDEPTPIYGGLVAAPVFAEVMRYGLRQFRIPPPPPMSKTDVKPLSPAAGSRDVGEVGGTAATARTRASQRPAPAANRQTTTTRP